MIFLALSYNELSFWLCIAGSENKNFLKREDEKKLCACWCIIWMRCNYKTHLSQHQRIQISFLGCSLAAACI